MKKRNRTKLLDRQYNKRDARLFVIATEGRETEKQYFAMFHDSRIKIEILATGEDNKEVWLYLHFDDLEPSDKTSKDFEARLRTKLGSYNKSNLDLDLFKDCIEEAVKRAKSLHPNPQQNWPPTAGSHVYRVVQMILKAVEKS